MHRLLRWFPYASLFALSLAACGGDDSGPVQGETESPAKQCITLKDMPCGCPGGGYGVYSCEGACLSCPAPQAGSGASPATPPAAPGGQPGFAGRGGGRGTMTTPPPPAMPQAGATPTPGAAGMSAGAAGMSASAGMPAAGGGGAGRAALPAAGGGGSAAPGTAGMPATVSGEVPATAACMAAATWPVEWSAFEQEVLKLVNENRAKGWNCDTEGMKPAAGPLTMEPTLRCSARLHSKDMADRMFFSHDNPDGKDPGARMTAAGYVGNTWGENIAQGQTTPAQVVAGWMDSDGHCANIMNNRFTLIGVGYFAGMSMNPRFNSELYWTQNFGASGGSPRR